jgi:hypothetical protein
MVNIRDKRCIHRGCKTQPNYNYDGETTPIYCSVHKLDRMNNIKSKKCITCNKQTSNKRYEGYCFRCFVLTYPDRPNARNYKNKEIRVADFIKERFPHIEWCTDQIVGGCSKRRPDIYIDLLTHIVIIEIDENQHTDYDTTCEYKRMEEISEDFAARPIVFIRFNPDSYYNAAGQKIKSPWTLNNAGLCVITDENLPEWARRLTVLEEVVKHHIENICEERAHIEHLFYDETDEHDIDSDEDESDNDEYDDSDKYSDDD